MGIESFLGTLGVMTLFWTVGIIIRRGLKKTEKKKIDKADKGIKKNWFRRNWILTILIILTIMVLIGSFFDSSSDNVQTNTNIPTNTNRYTNEDLETNIPTNTNEYTNEDLEVLTFKFVSRNSDLTDLQKEEQFKQYKNKWIKGVGIVKSISEVALSDNIAVGIESSDNPYLRGATIYFGGSEKSNLLKISAGEAISFEGRIESYNSLLGIIIKEAKLI